MADAEGDLLRRCEQFVYHEADLLDNGDFEAWLDLFDAEATYWLPMDASRHEPRGGLNLIYDDRRRLEDRLRRLRSGFSHTEDPLSRTSHVVGNLHLVGRAALASIASWIELDDDDVAVAGRAIIARSRRGTTDVFHGRVAWVLRCGEGALAIRLKRIDILGADQPLPPLTFLL
jgi:benzoate/toluate 1,2-dioxygenase beta subunit